MGGRPPAQQATALLLSPGDGEVGPEPCRRSGRALNAEVAYNDLYLPSAVSFSGPRTGGEATADEATEPSGQDLHGR